MEFQTNPNLHTIKPNYPGNSCHNGRFLNYQKVRAPRLREILYWRFSRNPQQAEKEQDKFKLQVEDNSELLNREIAKVVWLGHASFLLTLNNKNILLDPVFGHIPLVKRRSAIPPALNEYAPIDYVLISHAHYDHLDKATLVKLARANPQLIIYCGLNTASLLRKWRINSRMVEAGWYQQFPLLEDQLEFYFLPALHWSNRSLHDRNRRLWGSFIIKNQTNCIYFMGDSGYAGHFREIGGLFPQIDYALLGIGAYQPRQIMQSSHINPAEAYQAQQDLGADYLIPMHYATYDLTDEPYHEPLDQIEQLYQAEPTKLKVINPGQLLPLQN